MIITTEETKEGGIKYLNINVSNSEVERNPDIVRLCADVGILEYVKPKTDVLDRIKAEMEEQVLKSLTDGDSVDDWFAAVKVNECLEIIDKYKAESEE